MAASFLVTGDYVLDQHIYEGSRHDYSSPSEGVQLKEELGGAELVAAILAKLAEGSPGTRVRSARPKNQAALIRSYAFWRPRCGNGPKDKDQNYWRVAEAMGFGEVTIGRLRQPISGSGTVVVISDGGIGFRDRPKLWPRAAFKRARTIVFKTSAPVGGGKLFKHLQRFHRDQLVIVVSSYDLRKLSAQLSEGLSWEETLSCLMRELESGACQALKSCRQLIVSFGLEGAVAVDFGTAKKPKKLTTFVYEAGAIETELRVRTQGTAVGFQSCLAAAVAWDLRKRSTITAAALESGIAAMRDLLDKGHGSALETPKGFPTDRVTGAIMKTPYVFSRAEFPATTRMDDPSWTILRESLHHGNPAYALGRLVLLRGAVALQNLPHLKIGKLLTAERKEIESLRTLVQVVRRYERPKEEGRRPLSIAVFGPPGAGKSFAVKELVSAVVKDHKWHEFNLSQFNDARDLIGAFHQVRDSVLQHKLPVAFFDEFDSHNHKWLALLLAPMQDGRFQDGQLTHWLGKCIFAFAGGTSATFETFGPLEPREGETPSPGWNAFRLAKGPDFKSRLDGYLNVVGPNRREIAGDVVWAGSEWRRRLTPDNSDVCFPIRRALMARVELDCAVDEKVDLDEGVVNALLKIDSFVHGARSLSKVLQPFVAAKPQVLRRSLMLPLTQLNMHVDAQAFLGNCADVAPRDSGGDQLAEADIELVAANIHQTWRDQLHKENRKDPRLDRPHNKLEKAEQETNRAAARRMVENLRIGGMALSDGIATNDREVKERIEYLLEMLAEKEHDGWMAHRFATGWKLAEKTDKDSNRHSSLKPYRLLSKVEHDRDRAIIRSYPAYARLIKKHIVIIER